MFGYTMKVYPRHLLTPMSGAILSSFIFTWSLYALVISQIHLPSITTKTPVDEWQALASLSPALGRFAVSSPTISSRNSSASGKTFQNYINFFKKEPLKLSCEDCAYVTSSGRLLHSNAGPEIDRHDCVIRMNDAPVIGYETDVGSRTTIRSMSFINILQSLEHSADKRNEFFTDIRSKTEIFLINWMTEVQVDIFEDIYYRYVILLTHLYPGVKFFRFTPGKVGESRRLFFDLVGNNTKEMRRKQPSTGWHTLVAALELCGRITVYGMIPAAFCTSQSNSTSNQQTARVDEVAPYHYYPPHLWKNDCKYLINSERARQAGHPFLTERRAIKRLMAKYNITFRYPQWDKTS